MVSEKSRSIFSGTAGLYNINCFYLLCMLIAILPVNINTAYGAESQTEDGGQICPPNSSWNGYECKCLDGYGSVDGETCRPMSELANCPPNSAWDGSRCSCLEGYGSVDNTTCVLLSTLAQCPPHSQWDGRQCKCDPGYGVYGNDNKCISYYEICRRIDPVAVYNPSIKDCQCPEGYRENKAANRCEKIEGNPERSADKSGPVNTNNKTSQQKPVPKADDGNYSTGGDTSVTLGNGIFQQNNRQVIDASSKPGGDYRNPVRVGDKTVFMTDAGAAAYKENMENGINNKATVEKDSDAVSDWWGNPAAESGIKAKEGKRPDKSEKKSTFWD